MDIQHKLKLLREKMVKLSLDAYIVLGTDPHLSEYIPDFWKAREWITGFTGSFGNFVITKNKAGLWTDSRYFIQASKQLSNSEIELHKLKTEGYLDYPEWLELQLNYNSKIGIDGLNSGIKEVERISNIFSRKCITLDTDIDLITDIWKNRKAHSLNKISEQLEIYSGFSRFDKIDRIRQQMKYYGAQYHLIASLDDIAWTLNIRGCDVKYNPVAVSYLLINENDCSLFIDRRKLDNTILNNLTIDRINVYDYNEIIEYLSSSINNACFLIDDNRLNYRLFKIINNNNSIIRAENPSVLLKSIKNDIEVKGARNACLKDGIALTNFWFWLENNLENSTELSLETKLNEFRSEQNLFVSESFHSIVAYGKNAALPHYSANKYQFSEISQKGLLLIDSGGQYMDGTTDITRTMSVGELSQEEKNDYTIVLRGMINLSKIKFRKGARGCNIDFAARQALWEAGLDYGHGTGHGIGSYLNVHEGPQSIRQELNEQAILEGMITSNEPGCYKEGRHGIRHENLMLCIEDKKTEFGTFLKFETITLCYFDTKALNISLMKDDEIDWLNSYHKKVFDYLSPHLTNEISNWLQEKTKPIS